MNTERREHLAKLYSILDKLQQKIGGARKLQDCSGNMVWPERGVYFFQEVGENRSNMGNGPRVVRVGTHTVRTGSQSTLWARLCQHRGQPTTGGGNHRGSIFRLLIGEALIKKEGLVFPKWGRGRTADKDVRISEFPLERRVSQIIGNMRFLWLGISDEANKNSLRSYVEKNSIALLSNYNKPALDPPSQDWLGHYSRERIRNSGLWNQDYVQSQYDPALLDTLDQVVLDLKGAQ